MSLASYSDPTTLSPRGATADRTGTSAATRPLAVRAWLFIVCALIALMVVVGGATRLTDSGLSITEWKPLLGAIPPLSAADWEVALEKYRQIPEYQFQNRGMSMAEFQFIYWWEWGHRQLGRFIGLAFAVPLAVFWVAGWIPAGLKLRLVTMLALGGLQGFLGWYMVQSGLSERLDVSQYRLAAHLGLAVFLFGFIFWTAIAIGRDGFDPGRRRFDGGARSRWHMPVPGWLLWSAVGLVALVFAQTLLGALVAGMRAGLAYNTWPLMNGAVVPAGLGVMSPWWINAFENAMTVQFNHRFGAYVLFAWVAVHAVATWRFAAGWSAAALGSVSGSDGDPAFRLRSTGAIVLATVIGQMAIGIATLLAQVPIGLGLAHQFGALIVLMAALWHLHEVVIARRAQEISGAPAAA